MCRLKGGTSVLAGNTSEALQEPNSVFADEVLSDCGEPVFARVLMSMGCILQDSLDAYRSNAIWKDMVTMFDREAPYLT